MACEIRPKFEPYDLNLPIWHYIKREYAEKLFQTSTLRFKQVASWQDSFEARVNERSRKFHRTLDAKLESIDGIHIKRPDVYFTLREDLTRKTNYGSCWTYTNPKSSYMWENLRLRDEGVALESTVGSLLNFLTRDFMFSDLAQVRYQIPGTGSYHFDIKDYMFIKRLRYFREREVRLTVDMEWEHDSPFNSLNAEANSFRELPVDLSLIKRVVDRGGRAVNFN